MSVEYESAGMSICGVVMVTSWRPRPPVAIWLEGQTAAGRTVRILGDPYCDDRAEVWIDGERADITDVSRRRDGGTTQIDTERGNIYRPTPWKPERRATLDGEPLGPRP